MSKNKESNFINGSLTHGCIFVQYHTVDLESVLTAYNLRTKGAAV